MGAWRTIRPMLTPRENLETHVVVLGLGPAGRALTHRLAERQIDVVGIDVAPDRPWRPTYAAWADEIPDWVPAGAISTTSPARAWATSEHELTRRYVVLDTPGLQRALTGPAVPTLAGRVMDVDDHTVTLADDRTVRANIVIDARGTRPHPDRAQQTAYGLVFPRDRAPMLQQTWFMDWRRDNGTGPADPPSFLYVVQLDKEHVLAEETCLVGCPPLGAAELRRRLHVRLDQRGVRRTGDEREEHVRFSVEAEPDATPGRSDGRTPLRIGARGGLMHPATGYSVALSLAVADRLSDAVAAGARSSAELAPTLWSLPERQVRRLRSIGLRTLLTLPPARVPEFFEAFFRLPPTLQRTYLSQRDRPTATLAAMAAMAAGMGPSLSKVAVAAAFHRPQQGGRITSGARQTEPDADGAQGGQS